MEIQDIRMSALYIPGKKKVMADFLSRHKEMIPMEWSLNTRVFKEICRVFRRLKEDLDLFATALNTVHQFQTPWPRSRMPLTSMGPPACVHVPSVCSYKKGTYSDESLQTLHVLLPLAWPHSGSQTFWKSPIIRNLQVQLYVKKCHQ